MSRAFVKEDSVGQTGSLLPERPISDLPNYVTPTGLRQLREIVKSLAREHALLRQAGEDFDKPKVAAIGRDLRYYQARLESAIKVEVGSANKAEVHFGATVITRDEAGKTNSFTLVGADEADVAKGKISWDSPLAKALLGAVVGDVVSWDRPAGATTIEVVEIGYAGAD